MKTRFSVVLTVLIMLFCVSVSAQEKAVNGEGEVIAGSLEEIVQMVFNGADNNEGDVNADGKVNVADVVAFANMATVNLKITNKGSQSVTISPRFRFVLSSGITDAAWFAAFGTTKEIGVDETVSFDNVKIPNGRQMQGQNFAEEGGKYPSNVVFYDVNFVSETIVPEMLGSDIVFEENGTYEVVISSTSVPDPEPEPAPFGDEVYNFRIINQSGTAVTLNGEMCFVLANPDVNGEYHGWDGAYNRTGHIPYSYSTVTIGNGDMQTFAVSSDELVNRNPIDPNLLPVGSYSKNVYLYVLEPDGTANSEIAICNNIAPNVFRNGDTYDIVITAYGSVTPPSGSEVYNFRIINQSGTTVTLNGEMCFVLGNPDVYGNYHGWNGAYNRTGHIPYSYSTVTIGNGDMQTFSVSSDELVNRNPIDPNLLPAVGYSKNVYLYVTEPDGTANSEIAICNNMAPNVFQNGDTYDIVISAFRW